MDVSHMETPTPLSRPRSHDGGAPPGSGCDLENDDLETFAAKLGAQIPRDAETVVVGKDQLEYLNSHRCPEGNTLLMAAAGRGKADLVEFLLRCDGLELYSKNVLGKTAADLAWSGKRYTCLLILLQGDSLFPSDIESDEIDVAEAGGKDLWDFVEERRKLHGHISSGNLDSVKEATKYIKSSLYLSVKNVSALYQAAKHKKLEVFAFLWSLGASFRDEEEERKGECKFNSVQKNKLDSFLEEYFITHKDSHVIKLMGSTKVRGDYDAGQINATRKLYEHLNSSSLVAPLMKAVEYEDVEIVFDFGSECVERICYTARGEVYGLTVPTKRRIYIGAKGCDSEKSSFMNVAGTLAHELCHMALGVLHGDRAMPYKDGDVEKEGEFDRIAQDIEGRKEGVDEIITLVFGYDRTKWHSELIARVPHIVSMRGENDGERILREQVSELFQYYVKNVVPACANYSKDTFFKKPLCSIQHLQKYLGCIKETDRQNPPLKKSCKSFYISLVSSHNLSILVTTNTKLTCLQVFFELKEMYRFHFEKRCLFFELRCFEENSDIILKAFKCEACEKLILVTNDMTPDLGDISLEFEDVGLGDKKEVIVIVQPESLGKRFLDGCKEKVLHYHWNDFSDSYKEALMKKKVVIKGKSYILSALINQSKLSRFVQPYGLLRLTSGGDIVFDDGKNLLSKGYDKNCYIERSFVKTTVNSSLFDVIPVSCALFITGSSKSDLLAAGIKEQKMQWISGGGDKFVDGKSVFLLREEREGSEIFHGFFRKWKKRFGAGHWLHFRKGEFFWKSSIGGELLLREHLKEDTFSETELVEASHSRNDRVVLISDDPGTGKTTVLSDLLDKIKSERPGCWIGRINLNEYADDDPNNPLGLAKIEEDPRKAVALFCRIFGQEGKLEAALFEEFLKGCWEKKIFFDGFDEISPLYKENVLVLLRTLKDETNLQMWICTRKHEEVDLESEMSVLSYRIKLLTRKDQEKLLDGLWKQKLKRAGSDCPTEEGGKVMKEIRDKIEAILSEAELDPVKRRDRQFIESLRSLSERKRRRERKTAFPDEIDGLRSRIDRVNFISSARALLDETLVSIKGYGDLFKGSPLYLFMLGELAFDENLRTDVCSDVHNLFSSFVEGKMRIYFREKCRFMQITNDVKNHMEEMKKEIWKFHQKLSQSVLMPDKHKWDALQSDRLKKIVHNIGIVTKSHDRIEFQHKTFAEFFFASWMLDGINRGEAEEDSFERVLLDPGFDVVRRFVDCAFQKKEASFLGKLMKSLDVIRVFVRYVEETPAEDMECCRNVWKDWMGSLEKARSDSLEREFISILNHKLEQLDGKRLVAALGLLDFCLGDAFYFKFLGSLSVDILIQAARQVPVGYLSGLLCAIKRVLYHRIYGDIQNRPSSEVRCHSREEMDGSFEKVTDARITKQALILLGTRVADGMNIFHCACKNSDRQVFPVVLAFTKEIVGDKGVGELAETRAARGKTILHFAGENGIGQVVTVLKEMELFENAVTRVELTKGLDEEGRNFLHYAVENCRGEELRPMIDSLGETIGRELVRKMLVESTYGGETVFSRALSHGFSNGETSLIMNMFKLSKETLNEEDFLDLILLADYKGQTLYHFAVRFTNLEIIRTVQESLKSLLDRVMYKVILCSKNKLGDTVLCQAVKTNKSGVVESVFEHASGILQEADVLEMILQQQSKGYTLLHCAVEKSNSNTLRYMWSIITKILTRQGKIYLLKMADEKNQTVLHRSAGRKNFAFGREVLNICKEALPEEKFLELLLAADYKGLNFYHFAISRAVLKTVQNVHDALRDALNRGETELLLSSESKRHCSVLHRAVRTHNIYLIKNVYEYGVEVLGREKVVRMMLQQEESGGTLFTLPIGRFIYSILYCLSTFFNQVLDQEERTKLLTMVDDSGRTALHLAVLSKDVSTVKAVLDICRKSLEGERFAELIRVSDCEGKKFHQLDEWVANRDMAQLLCSSESDAPENGRK